MRMEVQENANIPNLSHVPSRRQTRPENGVGSHINRSDGGGAGGACYCGNDWNLTEKFLQSDERRSARAAYSNSGALLNFTGAKVDSLMKEVSEEGKESSLEKDAMNMDGDENIDGDEGGHCATFVAPYNRNKRSWPTPEPMSSTPQNHELVSDFDRHIHTIKRAKNSSYGRYFRRPLQSPFSLNKLNVEKRQRQNLGNYPNKRTPPPLLSDEVTPCIPADVIYHYHNYNNLSSTSIPSSLVAAEVASGTFASTTMDCPMQG